MADDNQESTISGIAADGPNGALEAQLAAENAEYKERMLRALAELDNYRRRAERERAEYLRFAPMEILRDLIPVHHARHSHMLSSDRWVAAPDPLILG